MASYYGHDERMDILVVDDILEDVVVVVVDDAELDVLSVEHVLLLLVYMAMLELLLLFAKERLMMFVGMPE